MSAPVSAYRELARRSKAERLAVELRRSGVTSANLAEIGDDADFWQVAAGCAGVRMPGPESIQLVRQLVREMEGERV